MAILPQPAEAGRGVVIDPNPTLAANVVLGPSSTPTTVLLESRDGLRIGPLEKLAVDLAVPTTILERAFPRQRILRAVDTTPGLTKSELGRRLDIPISTLDHHLRALVRAGLIVKVACAKDTLWGASSYSEAQIRRLAVLQRPAAARIRLWLRGNRQATTVELARSLGLDRKTVSRELALLMAVGLVERVGHGRPRFRLEMTVRMGVNPWSRPPDLPLRALPGEAGI